MVFFSRWQCHIAQESTEIFLTQILKFAGCAVVASESILVYAYILMYCFKNQGFLGRIFLLPWRYENYESISINLMNSIPLS
jgi:hypothetical protein